MPEIRGRMMTEEGPQTTLSISPREARSKNAEQATGNKVIGEEVDPSSVSLQSNGLTLLDAKPGCDPWNILSFLLGGRIFKVMMVLGWT